MELSEFVLEPDERVFRLKPSARRLGLFALLVGIAMLWVAGIGMAIAIFSRADPIARQFLTTMPALLGFAGLFAAWTTARTPREVVVGASGLRVSGRRGSESYPWDRIGWSAVEATALNNRRVVKLFDLDGRHFLTLSDALEEFDALAALIAARVAAREDGTADQIQLARARRAALGMAAGGVVFLALAAVVAWDTSQGIRAERLLKESAVRGEARVVRRFVAPNGVTTRLEYRIATPDGRSATRNAEVERPFWEALEGAETVPVLYVPGEPSISRLAAGEPEERDPFKEPGIGYGMPALVALMSLVFLVGAGFLWNGREIHLDPKSGRPALRPYGSGR